MNLGKLYQAEGPYDDADQFGKRKGNARRNARTCELLQRLRSLTLKLWIPESSARRFQRYLGGHRAHHNRTRILRIIRPFSCCV